MFTPSACRPRRAAPAIGLLLAALSAAAGCGTQEAAPRATPRQQGTQQETQQETQQAVRQPGEHGLRVDGRDRRYLLDPATGLGEGERAAVVVVLHQEGGTPQGVAAETALASLRESGATLVYPAGVGRSWDAGGCCGLPRREGVDDVEFLDALLDDVAARTPVDPDRTALVGYSSGGMLTYRYVCARSGVLAAAVVVSGSLESPCGSELTVPHVLTLHGKEDGTIGLDRSSFVTALGLRPRPVNSTLRVLTASAGCQAPVATTEPGADVYRWTGCLGGSVIEARLITGAGHGWGGLGASARTADFLRDRLLKG